MPLSSEIAGEIAPEEVRAELERVLASPTFSRSQRSQQFLEYVCLLTLEGQAGRINEYLIGSEVFKRGPDYSTDHDSFVRRQAHLLRQKLDTYYAREGATDPVRIELPVGHYVPVFHAQAADRPDISPPPAPPRGEGKRLLLSLTALGALLLLGVGWVLGGRATTSPSPATLPAVRAIWGSWFDNSMGPVICLSNPMTAVVRYSDDPAPARPDTDLRVHPAQDPVFRETFGLPPAGSLFLAPSRVNTKIGDAVSAVMLAAFFARAQIPVRITQSRLLSWEDLRTQDFILLGNNEANRWLDPLLSRYPFRLAVSEGRRLITIQGPRGDEAAEYRVEREDGEYAAVREYALISMLPGLDPRQRLLLVCGLNTQATQAAGELLTDPQRLEQLHARLRAAAPSHSGPWHFQLVIETEVRDKVPTSAPAIVAVRVL